MLDSFNVKYRDRDSSLDKTYQKQIFSYNVIKIQNHDHKNLKIIFFFFISKIIASYIFVLKCCLRP